jgi:predicted nuclease of predicted toxin-antitoxin system
MIIADENIPLEIIEKLRISNIETYSIFDHKRGISDKEIIEFAQNPPKIIVTEDKDFGDLVFAYNQKKVSVILLRYHYLEMEKITTILIDFIQNHTIEQHSFIVITPKSIRIRKV